MAKPLFILGGFILIVIPEPATTLTGLFLVVAGLGADTDEAPVGGGA